MSDEIITIDPELEDITVDEYGEVVNNQSQALATRPIDFQALMMPSNTVENLIARREAIQELVDKVLIRGVHYGQIPGIQGDSLWLPGGEFIAGLFGLQVDITLQGKDIDRSTNPPYFEYRYKAVIRKGHETIVNCEGSCNNFEDCFKVWVSCAPPDKDLQQEMIAAKIGKWDSYNGTETWKEKRDHPNPYSIINNIQKRAQKRAYVGAIEKATGVSGFFNKAADQKRHFGGSKNAGASSGSQSNEIGPTQFWQKVKGAKISQADAKALAEQAAGGQITWDQAIGQLQKAA